MQIAIVCTNIYTLNNTAPMCRSNPCNAPIQTAIQTQPILYICDANSSHSTLCIYSIYRERVESQRSAAKHRPSYSHTHNHIMDSVAYLRLDDNLYLNCTAAAMPCDPIEWRNWALLGLHYHEYTKTHKLSYNSVRGWCVSVRNREL